MSSLLERLQDAVAPAFTVEHEIGRGGMGIVFLGHDVALDRAVAIKVLQPELATHHAAARFLREARLLAKLSHPNVVPIHQVGEQSGLFYYIMDYVAGETAAARLERGVMTPAEVVALGADLLSGLDAAHRHGIVHRDVKPSNIFLLPDRAILADFGIAQPTSGPDTTLTGPGEIVGTLRYMSPEQRVGSERVDHRADLYATGVVLYEALTGRVPRLPGYESVDWSGVPMERRRVLRRALEPDASRRWESARAFKAALLQPRPLRARLALLAYDSSGVIDDPFARAVLHLERGRWLLALGDTAKADAELLWYENSDSGIEGWLHSEVQPGEVDAVASAVVRLFPGRLAMARQDTAGACRFASRVAELWAGAEPVYTPLLREARTLAKGCDG
jgi:serine/threonine protein kinase